MIRTIAVEGCRSLRDLKLPLGQLKLITGANGSGKSSVYRSLRLLADVAQNELVASLAYEGGLPSTFWAGPETIAGSVRQGIHAPQGQVKQKPASLKLGFGSDTYSYSVDLGFPKEEQKLHSRGRLCHTCIERCWFLVLFALSARRANYAKGLIRSEPATSGKHGTIKSVEG
jgi:predicted ATPase